MKTLLHTFSFVIILFVTLCSSTLSYAQLEIKSEVSHPSATVSDFTKYGKNNPQLYSGKVSVSVPVYTLSDEDFSIPISLNYSYNGFIPNFQAGEFGLGWTLSCAGFITREIRGLPDEGFSTRYIQSNGNQDVLGFDFLPKENKREYMSGDYRYQYLDENLAPENILMTYIVVNNACYDGTPDIYHFSFLGRSGSFVIDPETGEFKAYNTSTFDGDYKIDKYVSNTCHGGFLYPSSFTITTSDGYHYLFGDASDNEFDIYTERNTLFRGSSPSASQIQQFNYPAIAWALRKIIAPNGREVLFFYNNAKDEVGNNTEIEEKEGLLDFSETIYSMSPSLWRGSMSSYGMWSSESNLQPHEQLNSKCRLTSIVGDTFELNFHYDDKLPHQVSLYNKSGVATRLTSGYTPMLSSITDLRAQTIAKLDYTYNPHGNPYPFLTKVSLTGRGNYTFEYKDILTQYLPPMGTTATDHWGFLRSTDSATCNIFTFNSSSVGTQNVNFEETLPSNRSASFSASSVGLMTKVSYPTGGWSTFSWEPNFYRVALRKRAANSFRPTLDTLSQRVVGPGGRITKIVNYDSNGIAIDSTQYRYLSNSGFDSGVLLRYPRYSIAYNGTLKGNPFYFYYVTTGGLNSFESIAVEYPRVEEFLSDSSKIIHHFSSYYSNPDIFVLNRESMLRHIGEGLDSYVNMESVAVNHADTVSNILRPTTTLQYQRGQLIEQVILDKHSDTLKHTINSFTSLGGDFSHIVCVGESFSDIGIYGGGYYPLISNVTDFLDDDTKQSSSTEYDYNDKGQTTQIIQTLNNGDILTTIYRYASDIITQPIGNTIYHKMISDNVIGFPIEKEKRIRKKGETISTLLSKERYIF